MEKKDRRETLLLEGQFLKAEEEGINLGQIFEKTKQTELNMINNALKSEGIEL